MSIPKSFTFYSLTKNSLTWSVLDSTGQVVNSATVMATLYWDRDKLFPEVTPGLPVPNFTNVSLGFSSVTNTYSATIAALFDSPPGGNYVLVVDVKDQSAVQLAHWERPSVVVSMGP